MALLVTHTTAADGTFSTAGASAWNATHAIAGTLDLATETTGSLDLVTRTTGSLDLTTRSTGTLNLLTRTSGATANQLMYGGASGQVAQSANMAYDSVNSLLTVKNKLQVVNASNTGVEFDSAGIKKIANATSSLIIRGWQGSSGVPAVGGEVNLQGGNGSISADGGNVLITGGLATGSGPGTNGGYIFAQAGSSGLTDSAGQGGLVQFNAGDGYGASGAGGSVLFQAGISGTSGGTGGSVSFDAGYCTTSGTPGDITFRVGGVSGASTAVGIFSFGSTFGDPVAVAAGTGTTHAADLPVTVDGVQYYIQLYS